jgi:hypothetical protein
MDLALPPKLVGPAQANAISLKQVLSDKGLTKRTLFGIVLFKLNILIFHV